MKRGNILIINLLFYAKMHLHFRNIEWEAEGRPSIQGKTAVEDRK